MLKYLRAFTSNAVIVITDERKQKICDDLRSGSDPRPAFFLLVALSTLIAAFGLVMNSIAVVIGAMLVAPLMTPILGLSLGMIRGDAGMIGLAFRSEALGVIISVMAGALLGSILPEAFEPTTEMLARTKPSLFDLLVAVLAGMAGAYALVDEKLSPALPGVAIATAIVPPLANCGMCIALGAYQGAAGSFLLFFTNFLSILLVSGAVFYSAGMMQELESLSTRQLLRRFGVALLSLLVIAVLLNRELVRMFELQRLDQQVTATLADELKGLWIHDLDEVSIEHLEDSLLVRAKVQAPKTVSPKSVSSIQQRLQEVSGQPVRLFVRTTRAQEVSARGSVNKPLEETLDGVEVETDTDPHLDILQSAEQVLREYLEEKIGMRLERLNLMPFGDQVLLVPWLSGARPLGPDEVGELESRLREHLPETMRLHLLLQYTRTILHDKAGQLRAEFNLARLETPEETNLNEAVADYAREWLAAKGYWLHSWSFTLLEDRYHFLFEVQGSRLLQQSEWTALSDAIANRFEENAEIYVRSDVDAVVGPGGYNSLPELLDEFRQRNDAAHERDLGRMLMDLM